MVGAMVWVMPVMMGVVSVFGALLAGRQLVPVVSGAAGGGVVRGGSRGSRGAEMMMMVVVVMMVMTSTRWYSRHHATVYSLSPAASSTDASATPTGAATAPAAATRSTRAASGTGSRPVTAATTPAHTTIRFVPAMREQNEGMLISVCSVAGGSKRGKEGERREGPNNAGEGQGEREKRINGDRD